MKTPAYILTKAVSFLLYAILSLVFVTAQAQSSSKQGLINERRFQRLMAKKDVVLIDVRTTDEYKGEHIPAARLLDVQQPQFLDSIKTLDKNKTYLLYCRSGKRSQKAVNLMKEQGFKRVYHLKGGINDWSGAKE